MAFMPHTYSWEARHHALQGLLRPAVHCRRKNHAFKEAMEDVVNLQNEPVAVALRHRHEQREANVGAAHAGGCLDVLRDVRWNKYPRNSG